jgi:hypothetical protein
MKKVLFVLVVLCPLALCAQARPENNAQSVRVEPMVSHGRKIEVLELSPAVVAQHERVQRLIGPKTKQKISEIAHAFSARARQLPPTTDFYGLATADVRSGFQGTNLSGGDIDALVEIVMAQCATDSQSDLKNQMSAMQKMNQQKQAARAGAENEMSEEESLRLQMAMDRQSKFMEALSNIEKKLAQTQDSIIQNLK